MKALITGMNGFVGKNLINLLLNENIEVIGLDLNTSNDPRLVQYAVDINDLENIQKIIEQTKPDQIYHLAAPAFIPDSYTNPQKTFKSIIEGTVNLLEIIRNKSPESKFLYVGSSEEYGLYNGVPFSEEMIPYPCTAYGSAKAAASIICYQYSQFYDLNIVRTRSFNHIGPGQSPRFVCASIAKQIAELEKDGGNKISLGNLSTSRDFLDVRDVVQAYYKIMHLKDNSGELYNICSGRQVTIEKVISIFLKNTYINESLIIESETQYRKFDNIQICGDNTKLIRQTGWGEAYQIEQTIKDTLDFWRKQLC